MCQDMNRDNCGRATVDITVQLHLTDDLVELYPSSPKTFRPIANDVSKNHMDLKTLIMTKEPIHGVITRLDTKNGDITYIPDKNYAGIDVFYYTVCSSLLLKGEEVVEEPFDQDKAWREQKSVSVLFHHKKDKLRSPDDVSDKDQTKTSIMTPSSLDSWMGEDDTDDYEYHKTGNSMIASHSHNKGFRNELQHMKTSELFTAWLANHRFDYTDKFNTENEHIGYDIVIREIDNKNRRLYMEIEENIEDIITEILTNEPLETTQKTSLAIGQWLWRKHADDIHSAIVMSAADMSDNRHRICGEEAKVTLVVAMETEDDFAETYEGSYVDIKVLANDHQAAKPSTLSIVLQPSVNGASVSILSPVETQPDWAVSVIKIPHFTSFLLMCCFTYITDKIQCARRIQWQRFICL